MPTIAYTASNMLNQRKTLRNSRRTVLQNLLLPNLRQVGLPNSHGLPGFLANCQGSKLPFFEKRRTLTECFQTGTTQQMLHHHVFIYTYVHTHMIVCCFLFFICATLHNFVHFAHPKHVQFAPPKSKQDKSHVQTFQGRLQMGLSRSHVEPTKKMKLDS